MEVTLLLDSFNKLFSIWALKKEIYLKCWSVLLEQNCTSLNCISYCWTTRFFFNSSFNRLNAACWIWKLCSTWLLFFLSPSPDGSCLMTHHEAPSVTAVTWAASLGPGGVLNGVTSCVFNVTACYQICTFKGIQMTSDLKKQAVLLDSWIQLSLQHQTARVTILCWDP